MTPTEHDIACSATVKRVNCKHTQKSHISPCHVWLINPSLTCNMMTSWYGNTFRIRSPFWDESAYYRWFSDHKRAAIWKFFAFLVVSPNNLLNKRSMIWDTITLMWRYCDYVIKLYGQYGLLERCDHRKYVQMISMSNYIWTSGHYKQRVLMHGHQGWNVRHGLCHIYMRYVYIDELFIAFVSFVVCSLL